MVDDEKRPEWLPKLDLRYLTREPELCRTAIIVHIDYHQYEWIVMGQMSRMDVPRGNGNNSWRIGARMGDGATDFEEDSAYALSMNIISPKINTIVYGSTWIDAFIDPNPYGSSDFKVPLSNDYDPRKHPDAYVCEAPACLAHPNGAHPIVPEGMWMPPENPQLFKRMRGLPITIRIGVHREPE